MTPIYDPDSRESDRAYELRILTIYENPLDFPGEFVARWASVGDGVPVMDKEICIRAKTLAEVRGQLPPGLVRVPRAPGDEPQIVESWL